MTAATIASRFRRALRNGTGMTLTSDQVHELVAQHRLLDALAQAETEELCRAKQAHTQPESFGSTNGATEKRQKSGKLPVPTEARLFIAALARAT